MSSPTKSQNWGPCVDPANSKSKPIFTTGTRLRNATMPTPLKLYGQDLPWVDHATHLGHELHKDGNMDYDCKLKRGRFIDSSTDIREKYKFAGLYAQYFSL